MFVACGAKSIFEHHASNAMLGKPSSIARAFVISETSVTTTWTNQNRCCRLRSSLRKVSRERGDIAVSGSERISCAYFLQGYGGKGSSVGCDRHEKCSKA